MQGTYKALESYKTETGNSLRLVKKEISDLPEGDLLVKVQYSSLNYKDAMSAKGFPGVTKNYPHTPGVDAVGTVIGDKSNTFTEGDEVIVTGFDLGVNTAGGFGEYIRVPSNWAIRLPTGLSAKDSMILGTAGLTAGLSIRALDSFRGITNTKSIVSGSTGGVGSVAVKLLSHLGSQVTAISGKNSQHKLLKSLGAEEILSRENFQENVRKPLGKGVWDIGVDVVGGEILSTMLAAINPAGAVACSGLVGGAQFESSVFPFILRGIALLGIESVSTSLEQREIIWEHFASDWSISLNDLVKEVDLENLKTEIDLIIDGNQVGRVLVKI
tara:strand:- start:7127 stop:8110 length:984 start_codon:yes stop_codon:yes gene_type:complete